LFIARVLLFDQDLRGGAARAASRPRRFALSPGIAGKASHPRRKEGILEGPGTLWVPLQTSHRSADCVSHVYELLRRTNRQDAKNTKLQISLLAFLASWH